MYPGFQGDVYVEGGKEVTRGEEFAAQTSGVAIILGAGNFGGPIDVFAKVGMTPHMFFLINN
jgi:hypothetical protein